ncbi:MAG: VWA domain-containing protein [Planctomycetota bacterium]|nr:VWA domain-containing protein [Planctomycetota bacterium]
MEEVRRRGSDLVVLLDVSRSMLATDVPPSRLERAKSDVKLLLQRLKGERVGLIAFAGRAVAQCPLTTDHGFFRLALDDLDPRSAPRGGTAIGDAVRKALEMLPADAQRDQALLLITDGEDQDSFPLQAADLAAERKVAIFTVGLGDAEQGARVPGAEGKGFLSFEGKQVWSKMDPTLLQQLAMRTGGACVLAGTQAYDLGKIYDEHLAALRGEEVLGQVRRRRHERFQWFLAAALACFLAELLIKPYRPRAAAAEERGAKPKVAGRARAAAGAAALLALAACACQAGAAAGEAAPPEEPVEPAEAAKSEAPKLEPEPADRARDPYALAGEALELYGRAEYDAAARKLLAAREQLPEAAELAFDLGCARQRAGAKGEAEAHYEDASRTKDRPLALKARFNLGMLEGEEATRLAGVEPERLEPAQRGPVLEALERAIGHFRGCLNLEASYEPARKNLEMIRQWIKYHTDRWRQLDREKRRRELDLLAFLEWLAGAQESLKRGAAELAGQRLPPADAWYELKRAQGELIEEIPFVKEKIAQPQSPQAQPSAEDAERLKQAVEALTGLADQAGREMETAEAKLGAREGDPAAEAMGAAMEKLETIWDAAVPFPKLLQHDLQAQTGIVRQLSRAG